MKRPTILPKPPAPSIHPTLRPSAHQARPLRRHDKPLSEAELVADIEHGMGPPEGWLDSMRLAGKHDSDH